MWRNFILLLNEFLFFRDFISFWEVVYYVRSVAKNCFNFLSTMSLLCSHSLNRSILFCVSIAYFIFILIWYVKKCSHLFALRKHYRFEFFFSRMVRLSECIHSISICVYGLGGNCILRSIQCFLWKIWMWPQMALEYEAIFFNQN